MMHIFSQRPDQVEGEINSIIDFVRDVMGIFGFEYELEISTQAEEHYHRPSGGLGQGGEHTEERPRQTGPSPMISTRETVRSTGPRSI